MEIILYLCVVECVDSRFLMMPVQYSGQDYNVVLKVRRRIEDRLVALKTNLEKEISVTFNVSDIHGNVARKASTQARLCVAEVHKKIAPWNNCHAAKGKIENLPLARLRDMKVHMNTPGGADYAKLGPAERLVQIGPQATSGLLESLLDGTGMTTKDKLFIIDLNPCINGQWAHVAHNYQLRWQNNNDVPFVAYAGTVSFVFLFWFAVCFVFLNS